MENQQKSEKSTILNFGLYYGLAPIIITLILYASGNLFSSNWMVGTSILLIYTVIQVFIIIYGTKSVKSISEIPFTYAHALKVGVGIALIGGGLHVLFEFILQNYIVPDFFEQSLMIQEEALRNFGTDESTISKAMNEAREKGGYGFVDYGLSWIAAIFKGFIISLITALVFRTKLEVESL